MTLDYSPKQSIRRISRIEMDLIISALSAYMDSEYVIDTATVQQINILLDVLELNKRPAIDHQPLPFETENSNMAFAARKASICSECNKEIKPGQFIKWNRREHKRAYHFDCANPDAIVANSGDVEPTIDVDVDNDVAEPTPTPMPDGLMGQFASALMPYVEAKLAVKIDAKDVERMVSDANADLRKEFTADKIRAIAHKAALELLPSKVTVENLATKTSITIDNAHDRFEMLLYVIGKRHHAYLYGGPGSGKSTGAMLAAKALGREYGYISLNPQTPDSRLLGFIDAGGTYRDTVFHRLYRDGGVFCIDECDNASPSLLTTLNGCLENGHAAFPCGMVERHSDFIVVATGNTCGKGANPMFPERRPFDAAFAERFTFISWEYDVKLERVLTLANNPDALAWFEYVQKLRSFCATKFPRVLVSPRASMRGAEYYGDGVMTIADIAECVIFKGLDKGTVASILKECPLPVEPPKRAKAVASELQEFIA